MTYIRIFAIALLGSAGLPAIASAQTPPPGAAAAEDDSDIDAIIVTARKQNETLLDAPATISVLNAEQLQTKNITSANQLSGIVPGLVMTPGVGGLPGTTFRGLGSNTAIFSLESSVAQYVDGVYLGHARNYVSPFYDVDRVELIKGTQSTLLGKNTSLGAISIVNKRPTEDFGYTLRFVHSFTIDGNRAEGAVNIPLSDRVQMRAALFASQEEGFMYNDFKDRSEPRLTDLSGRLSLAFQPTETIEATLIYQHDRRRSRGQVIQVLTDPGGVVAARGAALGRPVNVVADRVSSAGSDPLGGTVAGPDTMDDQDTNKLNGIVNFEIGDHVLTSQTSYVRWDTPRVTDLDFTPANLFNLVDRERDRIFAQELRIASPGGGRLQYLAGVYFYKNKYIYDRTFGSSPSNTVGFPFTGISSGQAVQKTSTLSAFVSATVELFDGLKASGGARYTREKKEGTFFRNSTGALAGPFPNQPFTTYTPQITHPLDYDVGLQYKPVDDLLFYASHSKGSKSGGFQDFPTTTAGAPYAPETAYSTELGLKWNLRGGNYITAALFNTLVKDFQTGYTTAVGSPAVAQTVIGNSDIRSRGFEASGALRPLPGLKLNASIVYAKGIFLDDFPIATAAVARKGDPLTRAPRWSGQVGIDYEKDIGGGLNLFAGASVDWASTALHQFIRPQPDAPRLDKHQLIDARIGIRDEDKGWEFAVIGTNLTDKQYAVFATSVSGGGTGIGNRAFYGAINRPRVIALQFTLKR